MDEAGDVLLRTVGIGKTNVIETLKLSCTMSRVHIEKGRRQSA